MRLTTKSDAHGLAAVNMRLSKTDLCSFRNPDIRARDPFSTLLESVTKNDTALHERKCADVVPRHQNQIVLGLCAHVLIDHKGSGFHFKPKPSVVTVNSFIMVYTCVRLSLIIQKSSDHNTLQSW